MHLKYVFALFCLILLSSCAFAQDSDITIEFLKPSKDITYEKGQEIEVEARVTFPEGSTDEEVMAHIAYSSTSSEQIDLTKNAQGNYAAKIQTSYATGNSINIRVFGKANIPGGYWEDSRDITIDFMPVQIEMEFDLVPGSPYYLHTTIRKIKIDAFYPDGSRVPLENFERQPALRIGMERKRLDLREDPESGALVAELDYTIELTKDFVRGGVGELELELMDITNDKYGNSTGRNVEKRFEIEDSHDSLKLRIKNPPNQERLFHNIEMLFEMELIKGSNATDERVYLTDSRNLENERECQKVSEEGEKLKFQCQEKIPSMEEIYRIQYVALASADISGEKITVYKISENEISNIVHLDSEFPPEREPIPLDEIENLVEVNFYYSMAGKLEGGSYNGTINNEPVEFVWNAEEEVYVAEFDLKSLGEGQHELEFSVEGMDLENDAIIVNFVAAGLFTGFGSPGEDIDPIIIIGSVVAVFAVFTFIIWFMVLRKKKEATIDELKEEAAVLKELLKRIEIDYYKRRLSEVEYKKRSLEYQTRLEKIVAKIKGKGIRAKEKQK